jgi:hypothetical protein
MIAVANYSPEVKNAVDNAGYVEVKVKGRWFEGMIIDCDNQRLTLEMMNEKVMSFSVFEIELIEDGMNTVYYENK